MLGLPIPDTELTRSFDPKLRKTSLENLLADCLRARARTEPLVLVLEDCHWLDPLSRDLLDVIARTIADAAVLLVLVYRPEAALPQGLALAQLPGIEQLELGALDEEQMSAVVRVEAVAAARGRAAEAAAALRDLVVSRAQGNPFYAEELLNYVHAQGVDLADERALRSLELPDSLHSLILSRIDTLTEAPRRTLKVASVVGRVFRAPMLPGVYPELGGIDDVRADLGDAAAGSTSSFPTASEDESYLFKHAVTQEVAYESLPYALRATLHSHVGAYLERQPDAIERQLDLLAHHYWHSDDEPKKRRYLRLAAERAQAVLRERRRDRLLRASGATASRRRTRRGAARARQGARARRTSGSARARRRRPRCELAEAIGDARARPGARPRSPRSRASRADSTRRPSAWPGRAPRSRRSATTRGSARCCISRGRSPRSAASSRRRARATSESLAVRRRLGDIKMMASVLSNLGIVAEYEGDYALARSLARAGARAATEIGDRWAIAVSMTNLGMIASLEGLQRGGTGRFEEAMRLNREVGDSWMVAISHNNLGNANRGLGDYAAAREHYAECLRAHREHDDKWALAFVLEDVARLAALSGQPERALELLGAADALHDQIGAPRARHAGAGDRCGHRAGRVDVERRAADGGPGTRPNAGSGAGHRRCLVARSAVISSAPPSSSPCYGALRCNGGGPNDVAIAAL